MIKFTITKDGFMADNYHNIFALVYIDTFEVIIKY